MSQFFSSEYAVVVGVGADLPITLEDAGAIANQLRDPTRCAYPPDQVRLPTSETARRPGTPRTQTENGVKENDS